jgi:Cft2 family RNA processing exonuclease
MACFHYSGHILGAAGIELFCEEGPEQRTLFYTSDTNLRNQTIIPGGDYPEEVDILVLESTMASDGLAESVTRRSEERRLGEAIARALERGGSVLIPVFALGRAQEVIALIDRFKRRGIIRDEVPIYTAGSMRAVADLYDQTRFTTPRLDSEFEVFGVEQKRLPRSDQAKEAAIKDSGIFVVSSGMMFERTLSNDLARMMVDDERHAILFVGFAREDSPGGQLIEAADREDEFIVLDKIQGQQRLRADVDRFRLSGHSHRRDLLELVERLRPKQVVLVHGESQSIEWMAENIRFFNPSIEVHVPACGQPTYL